MYFQKNIDNIEKLKVAYREWAVKLHPDNAGDTAEFQAMQQEFFKLFEELKKAHNQKVEKEGGQKRYESPQRYADIIEQCMKFKGVELELCGTWLWASGKTAKYTTELKNMGFKFARKKKIWYYRAEDWHSGGKKSSLSMEEIRAKYGSEKIKERKEENIQLKLAI